MKKILQFMGSIVVILLSIYGFQNLSRVEENIGESSRETKKQELFFQYSDVYAWLQVDGTKIDYPIVQHPSDDSYYLFHDVDGVETYYGAIFTELVNTKTFEDAVTIIYGHAMADDAMFGSLDYFADTDFFKNHKTIIIDTQDKHYEYEILAAHTYTDDHLFDTFDLGHRAGVIQYMSTLKERTLVNGGFYRQLPVDGDKDSFLILSTCDAENSDYRFVVTARLKRVKERGHE